jgi:hypothetical protein
MRTSFPLRLILGLTAACEVGDAGPGPSGGTADASPGGADGGADAAPGATGLTITVTTSANGGNYAPKNIVAVWIERQGTFIKTIDRWAATRKQHLVAWTAAAGAADADAVSGATRANHTTPLSITWDLTDRAGAVVPDGTYTIRMESADANSAQATQNHQGTFTFVKGPQPQAQIGLTSNGFTNTSITFTP